MNERLLSYAILLKCEFITLDKYNEYLNEIFLQHSDNDLLLELQWCSTDTNKTINTIVEHSREAEIDYDMFGKLFLDELKVIYTEMEIHSFAEKAYSAWSLLPKSIDQNIPRMQKMQWILFPRTERSKDINAVLSTHVE